MLPKSGSNQYAYNFANLLVQVIMGREFRLKTDYSFMVFSENLMLMASESTWKRDCHNAWRAGRMLTMRMYGNTVWTPGEYFFLMAAKDAGCVIRFDLTLDGQCGFTVGEPRRCGRQSDEAILAHQVFDTDDDLWDPFCPWVGFAQRRHSEIDEVLHGFFSHPQLFGYEYTPASDDKVCRLLMTNAQKGLIHLCSKHYYASIVFEKMAGRLNDYLIDADDIDEDKFLD